MKHEVKLMDKITVYKDLLEKFCKNLTLTTFPHSQELLYRNIFLNEVFYNIDVIEGKQASRIAYGDYIKPSDVDIDEIIKRIDARIKELEELEERNKQDGVSAIESPSKSNKKRAIITGLPGSGKSILLKRLVLSCLNSNKETQEFFEKYKNILDESVLDSIPILVILRNLELVSVDELENENLENIIYKLSGFMLGESFTAEITGDEFSDILTQQKITLFLDGLDEILDDDKKETFLKKLKQKKEYYNILITTRTGDSDNSVLFDENVEFFHIPEFVTEAGEANIDIIEGFSRNFYKVIFKFNQQEQESYKEFIKQIAGKTFLKSMISTPFSLSFLLTLFIANGSLPENRAELLFKYIDLFLSWYTKKNRKTGLSQTTANILLSYTAFYMVKNRKLMLNKSEFAQVLSDCYTDMDGRFPEKMEATNIDIHIKELLTIGLIDDRMSKYSFSQHRLLLEYFAAYAVKKRYVDTISRSKTRLAIFSDRFNDPKWKEVIVWFCLMDSEETSNIIDSLISTIENIENIEDNYYPGNLLFELSTAVPMFTDERHRIYDTLFKEHITDRQIQLIISLLSTNSIVAEDFSDYIEKKFEESVAASGERPYYNYAYAISVCYDLVKHETDPLWQAEKMLQSSDLTDVILGLEIYTILAWCRYMNIRNMFSIDSDVYRMYDRAIQSFRTLIGNIDSFAMPGVIARAFQECVIAGFVAFSDIVDYDLYKKIVSDFSHNNDKDYLRTILSVFDFSYSTKDISISDMTKKVALDKLIKELEEKNQNAVFDFSVCASIGVFKSSFFEEICKIFEKDKSDSMSRAWFLCLNKLLTVFKIIRDGVDEDNFAIEYFNYQLSDEGKRYFNNLSDNEPIEKLTFNLSYYLRRGELKKVYKDQIPTSPMNLLYGDMVGDVASIIEHALILSHVSKNDFGDLSLGYCYLETEEESLTKNHDALLQSVKRWLEYEHINEAESIIVSYWLWRLCILDIEDLPPVDYLLDRIIMDSKLCTQIFDFVVELTRYSEFFISKTIQKLQNSLSDTVEIETCILEDDEEYFILKEFMVNETEYTCFVSLEDYNDFFFRKTVIEDGEEYICGLEDDKEFDLVYTNFLKNLLTDIRDL